MAVLRTPASTNWIGWLGLVVAIMIWVAIGAYAPDAPRVFLAIGRLRFVGFVVWLVAMGVAWLRMVNPVVTRLATRDGEASEDTN